MNRRDFSSMIGAMFVGFLAGRRTAQAEPEIGFDPADGPDRTGFVSMGGDNEIVGVWIDEADPIPAIPPHLLPAAGERWWFNPPRDPQGPPQAAGENPEPPDRPRDPRQGRAASRMDAPGVVRGRQTAGAALVPRVPRRRLTRTPNP